MTVTLQGEVPQSWNKVYSGRHWSYRAAEAQRVHALVMGEARFWSPTEMGLIAIRWPNCPVDITITAFFKGRQLDADNIASKFYIDGLKGWLIKDDSPAYVRSVTTRSMIDKTNPRVEIDIQEVNDNE